jgi:hypothetical protein
MVAETGARYHSNSVSRRTLLGCHPTDYECRGTKNIKYLIENVDAAKVQLSPAEVQAIRNEIEKVEVVGERYPPFLAKYSFANTPEL